MKINQPLIPKELECIDSFDTYLSTLDSDSANEIENKQIKGAFISDYDFYEFTFEQVVFDNCRFVNCSFHKASFTDVRFNNCDLSNSNFSNGYFSRCQFVATKAVGANFTEAFLRNTSMNESIFKYASFHSIKGELLLFDACDCNEAFFTSCKLKSIEWNKSSFVRVEFFRTPLKGFDFTSCNIENIVISSERSEIRGMIVNQMQAIDLAKLLGVVIR